MLVRASEIKKEHVDGIKNNSDFALFSTSFFLIIQTRSIFKIWPNSPDIELLSESNFRESRTTGRLAYVNVLHETSHFPLYINLVVVPKRQRNDLQTVRRMWKMMITITSVIFYFLFKFFF